MITTLLALVGLAIWIWLLTARGAFWRDGMPVPDHAPPPGWPAVVTIVPARNETESIGSAVGSILNQGYPGSLRVVLVDDESDDDTAGRARRAAERSARADGLEVVAGTPPPSGWTGKLWALEQGLRHLRASPDRPEWIWFTDADIVHGPDALARLVAHGKHDDRDLVSEMVLLETRGLWAGLLIPPFVFFFRKLYPFRWVADPTKPTAAAAGGSVILRAEALRNAGGVAAIRGSLIDDCALARRIARHGRPEGGRIWLGVTERSRSIRPYQSLDDVWRMVARSAYTELQWSPLLLGGTVLGMFVTYLLAPILVLTSPWHGAIGATIAAAAAWVAMAIAIGPTLRLYGRPIGEGLALPLVAALYLAMTVDSALQHHLGRGGYWKGRVQGHRGSTSGGETA